MKSVHVMVAQSDFPLRQHKDGSGDGSIGLTDLESKTMPPNKRSARRAKTPFKIIGMISH
ncbi:hypothetical protein [Acetobacter aceti]|uniref:hypothetical protein n=1 Tax=Acetobacter aceti TaxID=435 RepID=UPI001623303E|nr:hypothetical protein [Acetobacter aceti]